MLKSFQQKTGFLSFSTIPAQNILESVFQYDDMKDRYMYATFLLLK